ncbi:hypothetical protein N7471_002871 [Penicillium samsonianum]|uniref:uncharacterized protein n=1 Tax=Penicillium samsonianum TaxID=1882272 RepID=UPI002548B8A4|nr:uncharacterized protein N7471_002871 [Penicillium samsonianum]KAJ6143418.1 hypothetical protein N7471_002871 [Penicillium samsonianum]
MGKEEEGRTVCPGPDEGFYNLPRGVFFPADAPILTEASVMARIAKASKEPLDHSEHIDSHPSLCTPNPRAPSAQWKRLNVSGRGRQPSSTRVSAIPWRLGAKLVSIYAPLPSLNFGAKVRTGSIQELTRKDMKGGNSGAGKRTIKVDSFSKSPKDKTDYTGTGMTYFPLYLPKSNMMLWSNTPYRENQTDSRDVSRPYIIFGIGAQEPKNEDRCIQFRSHGYCWTSLHEPKDREKDWHSKLFPNR